MPSRATLGVSVRNTDKIGFGIVGQAERSGHKKWTHRLAQATGFRIVARDLNRLGTGFREPSQDWPLQTTLYEFEEAGEAMP